MKAYNLVLGRFLEASVCVMLLWVSVASLHRESTDSLILSVILNLCLRTFCLIIRTIRYLVEQNASFCCRLSCVNIIISHKDNINSFFPINDRSFSVDWDMYDFISDNFPHKLEMLFHTLRSLVTFFVSCLTLSTTVLYLVKAIPFVSVMVAIATFFHNR